MATIQLDDHRAQFICLDCTVRARFDNGPVQRFDASDDATDGSDQTLFLSTSPDHLATLLQKAKTATFEVTIFDSGEQQLTFPVKGLQWGAAARAARRHKG
jgi:hypothetical protein